MTTLYRRGHRGPVVVKIQDQLNVAADITFSEHPKLGSDGIFGRLTKRRVAEFQNQYPQLKVDGIVGPNTWAVLFGGPMPSGGGGGGGGTSPAKERQSVTVVVGNTGLALPAGVSNGHRLHVAKQSSFGATINEVIEELDDQDKSLDTLVIFGNRGSWISPAYATATATVSSATMELAALKSTWGTAVPRIFVIANHAPAHVSYVEMDVWAGANFSAVHEGAPIASATVPEGMDAVAMRMLSQQSGAGVSVGYTSHSGGGWKGPWVLGPAAGAFTVTNLDAMTGTAKPGYSGAYAVSAINCL